MNDLMRILIVDDDPLNLEFMAELLRSRGYDVVTAADGEVAWEMLQQSGAPRMLVVDWILPGLSGPELCRRVRGQEGGGQVYIILITGHNPTERLHEGLAAGADDFLAKPYHPKVLLSHIAVGVRQLASTRSVSARVLRSLQDAQRLGRCDVAVRGQEAIGRICFQDGAVVWADLSNDPESLYERLLQESGTSLGRLLPMSQQRELHGNDSSSERIAMAIAEFAELRSSVRDWVKRKVAQILRLSVIDVGVIPMTYRSNFPSDLALQLEEVLPESLAGTTARAEPPSGLARVVPLPTRERNLSRPPSGQRMATQETAWEQAFPMVSNEQSPRLRDALIQAMSIRGAIGAAALQLHQNGCLARMGRLVAISPLLGALHVVKELYAPGQEIGSSADATPELIVTSGAQHQLVHVVPGSSPIALLLVLDANTSTLAMARHQMQQLARDLLLPATPSLGDSGERAVMSAAELAPEMDAESVARGGDASRQP